MGALASELGDHVERLSGQPRIYADANVPAGLVSFMRLRLCWDVLFVIEHDELRRARDGEHYRLARQLRRTLLTLDRDYFNDRHFPPSDSGGVIVVSAPDERTLAKLLRQIDRTSFARTSRAQTRLRPATWPVRHPCLVASSTRTRDGRGVEIALRQARPEQRSSFDTPKRGDRDMPSRHDRSFRQLARP